MSSHHASRLSAASKLPISQWYHLLLQHRLTGEMTMIRWALAAMVFCGKGQAMAGEIQIAAFGKADAPADYVTIGVTVHGQCFDSSSRAAKSVNLLANKLEEKLKAQQSNADRELAEASSRISLGFQRRDEYHFDGDKQVRVCTNGWYTGVRLTAKYRLGQGGMNRLPAIQDTILEAVDANAKNGAKGEPQVWADFSGPTPEVTPDKREKMSDEALVDAIRRARREVKTLVKEFPQLKEPVLAQVKPASSNPIPMHEARMYTMKAAPADMDSNGGAQASFEFGTMTEQVSRVFVFRYPGPGKIEAKSASAD